MIDITNNREFTTEHKVSLFMLFLLFIYMFALNYFMPLHRDDYEYALIWGTFDKLTNWPDIFQSLYNHYLTHGGRMVDFLVLDTFLLIGKEWFNPVNAFFYVALMVLIYWHSQREVTLKFNPYILGLIITFCWFGLPHFGLVNVWMTGACVYLMPAVFIFAFLLPYHFYFFGKSLFRDSLAVSIVMFLGGFISAWTIENTAATMNFIIAALIYYMYKQKKLTNWMIAGFSGSCLGYLLLVIAPGNYVRYAGVKSKLIYHFTNQIAAGGEMALYVLPVILFFILVKRILVVEYAKHLNLDQITERKTIFTWGNFIIWGLIVLMLISYSTNSFVSKSLAQWIYSHVAIPLGVATDHLKTQFYNMMSGLEEMVLYLLTISQIFRLIFKKLTLNQQAVKAIEKRVARKDLLQAYPIVYEASVWIGLALLNNLVMIASPSFPGRACYGSVVFLIIGAMCFFRQCEIKSVLLRESHKSYLACMMAILVLPMAVYVFNQYKVLYNENTERMAYVEEQVAQGASYLEVEPLSIKTKALRHLYFVDLNNSVSKYGLCRYYGLKDIKVTE